MKTMWLMSVMLLACSNEAAPVPTTVTSAGINVAVDPGSQQITTDRCNRQLSCGNIGKDRTWRDRTACVRGMDKQTHALLGESCSVIDGRRLAACLSEIRDQRCAESGDYPASCANLCR